MRLLHALLATALSACSLVLLSPAAPASACSCVVGTPADHLERADVVFVGTLTESSDGATDTVGYVFDVDTVFKGEVGTRAEVASSESSAACGLAGMKVGSSYLMFVGSTGSALRGDLCGGSQRAKAGLVQRIEALAGPGVPPSTVGPATTAPTDGPTRSGTDSGGVPILWYVGGGALGLGLGAGLLLARRRGVGSPA